MIVPTSYLPTFTMIHVAIDLAAIASGSVVLSATIADRRPDAWTVALLASTVLTSVTGFLSPFRGLTPGIAFGILSLVVLGAATYARDPGQLAGAWRRAYVLGSVSALYLNFVVLIAQSFQKLPALHSLASNQDEPPFLAVPVVSMIAFLALGTLALRRFRGPSLVMS